MTWLKVDDSMLDHPKWVRAVRDGGSGVIHLWLALATWSARHLTDGVIPHDLIETVGGPQRRRKEALEVLVRSGLCTVDGQGTVTIHDFTEHNPSREKVLADRGRVAKNKYNSRHRGDVTGHSDKRVTDTATASRPDPVPTVPSPESKNSLRARGPNGELPQSSRELGSFGAPALKYTWDENWLPGKEHTDLLKELGLTMKEGQDRLEHCRLKAYPHGFPGEDKRFKQELRWAKQEKDKQKFAIEQAALRKTDETPGSRRGKDRS